MGRDTIVDPWPHAMAYSRSHGTPSPPAGKSVYTQWQSHTQISTNLPPATEPPRRSAKQCCGINAQSQHLGRVVEGGRLKKSYCSFRPVS